MANKKTIPEIDMSQIQYFGQLMRFLRNRKGISLREIARQCKASATYLSDIERGNREPPAPELLEKIMNVLVPTGKDRVIFERMAYAERKKLSTELTEYLCTQVPSSIDFIRKAKELNLSDEYFQELIKALSST